eukprot:gnl/TRDRNA2_/TRDRNA2_79737_c0_seq2.p1 gnl/TRDRNA2_/TRDRNA2_79737_c0~~gnl/TRDRNA2_/TRDRNA2_79737_c0_seq2.p1  ORF type:complete len:121 (+),score=22.32 gnl/TRDRNA2_/TRDRNA2_79737_c0_seq2:90-452(+)
MHFLSQWNLRTCLEAERQQDDVCRGGELSSLRFRGSLLCYMETTTECEIIVVGLYVYVAAAALTLFGAGLCVKGLLEARQRIEEKWTRVPEGHARESTWGLTSADPDERSSLLSQSATKL